MSENRTILSLFRQGVDADADARLIKFGQAPWITYGEMDARSGRMAAVLRRLGVKRGDRVATLTPNREEVATILFACSKLGAIQVPLNPFLKGEFLRHQLADSGPTVLLADPLGCMAARAVLGEASPCVLVSLDREDGATECPATYYGDLLEEAGATEGGEILAPEDLIAIMYTSGTTGLPKGCMVVHGYLVNASSAWPAAGWMVPGDVQYSAMPLFHMGGQLSLAGALAGSAPIVVEAQFSASSFMRRAAEEGATLLRGVGAMGVAILAQPPEETDAENPFRLASFVPLRPDQQKEFERRFNVPVASAIYGQTECHPMALAPLGVTAPPGTAGKPRAGLTMRIVDDSGLDVPTGGVGEIVVRPHEPLGRFSGYWNASNLKSTTAVATDGDWHHTGDYGRMDEEGFLHFVDRKKDAIRRRGENVSSIELETAVRVHPAVRDIAVVAVPSRLGEDEIRGFVVFEPDQAPAPEAFFAFLKANVPYFAVPSSVVVVDELPVTPTGRVQKHRLRESGTELGPLWDFEAMGLAIARDERRAATT